MDATTPPSCIHCGHALDAQRGDGSLVCLSCSLDSASDDAEYEAQKQCPQCGMKDMLQYKGRGPDIAISPSYYEEQWICTRCQHEFRVKASSSI